MNGGGLKAPARPSGTAIMKEMLDIPVAAM
jgi:hypothetical protein